MCLRIVSQIPIMVILYLSFLYLAPAMCIMYNILLCISLYARDRSICEEPDKKTEHLCNALEKTSCLVIKLHWGKKNLKQTKKISSLFRTLSEGCSQNSAGSINTGLQVTHLLIRLNCKATEKSHWSAGQCFSQQHANQDVLIAFQAKCLESSLYKSN